jgi:hypothetical protein
MLYHTLLLKAGCGREGRKQIGYYTIHHLDHGCLKQKLLKERRRQVKSKMGRESRTLLGESGNIHPRFGV